jgi:hypothetical protein
LPREHVGNRPAAAALALEELADTTLASSGASNHREPDPLEGERCANACLNNVFITWEIALREHVAMVDQWI